MSLKVKQTQTNHPPCKAEEERCDSLLLGLDEPLHRNLKKQVWGKQKDRPSAALPKMSLWATLLRQIDSSSLHQISWFCREKSPAIFPTPLYFLATRKAADHHHKRVSSEYLFNISVIHIIVRLLFAPKQMWLNLDGKINTIINWSWKSHAGMLQLIELKCKIR